MHVDDFITDIQFLEEKPDQITDKALVHAKWFFLLHRLPALEQSMFHAQISQYRLFCDYEGKRYRVTGASRMGDVWLAKDMKQERGYDLRVDVEKCSKWGAES